MLKKRPREPARIQLRVIAIARCVLPVPVETATWAPGFWHVTSTYVEGERRALCATQSDSAGDLPTIRFLS